MALTKDAATYEKSKDGKTKLKNDFSGDIDALVKALNGDKYATFKKTIKANWVGEDADAFLDDIEKTRAALEKNLKNLKSTFKNAIDNDEK